uniref:Trafficking protein particle complex subunit 2-like n=1 Tax=Tetraselmis sp. GSL018 TaxID=582737 RepID=A0A061R882_9CHLO|mmetsp:Transcript_24222/g.57700  ORF Transcript_24222/g.57700 Transcript_24222/m.57700 type:complete len:136 (-) Transcript_24222:589-996(-)
MNFVIVGYNDVPLYEADFNTQSKASSNVQYLHHFVLHAALDAVEDVTWTTPSMYLKVVDRFNDLFVSAYVTSNQTRFLLLHESRNEDGIKSFFQDVHELYIKVMLNPFHTPTTRITSPVFNMRVRSLAKKYLGSV